MNNQRILIVDDEEALGLILKDYMENENMSAEVAFNGQQARHLLKTFNPTLVILDIMLPDDDGMELCRLIRNTSDIPVIMLSAKNGDIDKILSLGLGADEYLTKPYSPAVVVAHVKALLRRYKLDHQPKSTHQLQSKSLFMDQEKHTVQYLGQPIALVSKEFDLLWFLANQPGTVFTKEAIYDAVWGEDEFGEISTVTVHIRKIRSKMEAINPKGQLIKTIWGVGYKFED